MWLLLVHMPYPDGVVEGGREEDVGGGVGWGRRTPVEGGDQPRVATEHSYAPSTLKCPTLTKGMKPVLYVGLTHGAEGTGRSEC